MKQTTRIALAGLLNATGTALQALAAELTETAASVAPETPTPAQPEPQTEAPKPKRGRAAKAEESAAPATPAADPTPAPEPAKEEAPAPEPTPAAEDPTPTAGPEAKTPVITKDALRELFRPLVEGGRGLELRKIIEKYDPVGKTLASMDEKHHAAFAKDVEALLI